MSLNTNFRGRRF